MEEYVAVGAISAEASALLCPGTVDSMFRSHRLLPRNVSMPCDCSYELTAAIGGWLLLAEIVGNGRMRSIAEVSGQAVCVDVRDADGKLIQLSMRYCAGDPNRLKEMKSKHTIFAPLTLTVRASQGCSHHSSAYHRGMGDDQAILQPFKEMLEMPRK